MAIFLRTGAAALLLGCAVPALALDFELGDGINLKMVNKFTLGAGIRTQPTDNSQLGVLNVPGQQTLCQASDCLSFQIGTGASGYNKAPNQSLVDAAGGFFLHASDDGDMNYHNGEFYTAIGKLNADWTLNWGEWTFKTNFVGYFDSINSGFTIHRNNTVHCTGATPSQTCTSIANGLDHYNLGPDDRPRNGEIENRLAARGEFREYFVTRSFTLFDKEIFATLGNQRLRWGEANLTLLNTLDVINPQDAVLARQPGLALNELNLPTGMLNIGSDIFEGVSLDGWYQYKWDPVRPEPAGSMFSNLTDAAGGGDYAVIALGQYPEDPDALWFSQGVTGLISNSHRTVYIPPEDAHAPADGGQYGARLKLYLPNFNNGTELGFYYANYHSRLPYASVYAAHDSCLRNVSSFAEAANACHGFNAASNRGDAIAALQPTRCDPISARNRTCYDLGAYTDREPLPIDTMGVFLDFPEDIHMFGVSFNTTLGGWSFAGEYSYRPNLPAQLLLSDVVFAGLQPVVGRQQLPFTVPGTFVPDPSDPNIGPRVTELLNDFADYQVAHPSENPSNAALPDAKVIFPSYVAQYRGYDNGTPASHPNDIKGGQYIPGYERLKVGQFALTALQLFSTNPFGSDDLLVVLEAGFTNVFDMPEQDPAFGPGHRGLYFQGAGDQSHPSPGADGTGDSASANPGEGRINPTQQTEGFADSFAWGLRSLVQLNYSNLFDIGLNVKPTALMFWDVNGIAPSPMQNYVENSRWFVPAFFFECGSDWSGTLIYQYFGGERSALKDRDNVSMSITYAF